MHLSDEVLLAFLDREVGADERSEIAGHVHRCEACATRFTALLAESGQVAEALTALDVDPPWTDIPEALAQAVTDAAGGEAAGSSVRSIATAPSVRRARRFSGRAMAVAASLVLFLAAGAWAIPGSPIRVWLEQSATAVAEFFGSGTPETEVTEEQHTAGSGTSGIFVQPLNGQVRISVRGGGADTQVRILLIEADVASVRSTGPGGSYSVGPGVIDVVAPSGEMVIELPSRLAEAEIEMNGSVVVRKRGSELHLTPAADSSTAQILLGPGG